MSLRLNVNLRPRLALIVVLGAAGLVIGAPIACDSKRCEDRALGVRFGDTSFPILCNGDTISITPHTARLRAASTVPTSNGTEVLGAAGVSGFFGDGGAAGETGKAGAAVPGSLRMTVSANSSRGQPREGFHVDVSAKNGSGLVRLVPENDRCQRRGQVALHCVLSVQGTASFAVEHLENGSGLVTIEAASNGIEDRANVHLEQALPAGLSVRIGPAESHYGLAMETVSCHGPAKTCEASRSVAISARLQNSTGQLAAASARLRAHAYLDFSQGSSHGSGYLSSSPCPATYAPEMASGTRQLPLDFNPGAPVSEVGYLCVGPRGIEAVIATSVAGGSSTETRVFVAPAIYIEPRHVDSTGGAAGAGGAGAASTVFSVEACDGNPVAGAVVRTSNGMTLTTQQSGTTEAVMGDVLAEALRVEGQSMRCAGEAQ